LQGGLNPYNYVAANPLMFSDPRGLKQVRRLKYTLILLEGTNNMPDRLPPFSEYYVYVDDCCKARAHRRVVDPTLSGTLRFNGGDITSAQPAMGWGGTLEIYYEFYPDPDDPCCDCTEKFAGGRYENNSNPVDTWWANFWARLGIGDPVRPSVSCTTPEP